MKIINLKSENFKKIKAIDITPEDNTVIISGKNGQGKTSILDSIFAALAGKDGLPQKPIRDGEKEAKIEVDLGEYKVTRTFKDDKTSLTVSSGQNQKWTSPQTMLNEIISKLSFDPLEFSNNSQKEQRQILMDLAELNFDDENAKREALYNQRRQVGIEGKALAQYSDDEISEAKQNHMRLEIVVSKLSDDYNKAVEEERNYISAQTRLIEIAKILESLTKEQKELSAIEKPTADLNELKAQIDQADESNQKIRKARQIIENTEKVNAKRKEYESLTTEIDKIDEAKKQILAYAKMPIEGLTIDDEGVLFKGIPFSQLSTSEKLKVSMSIAVAMNPKLKVIRILDGSLLDEDNLKVISEIAKDNDYQVWIECVSSDKSLGFYIEDGAVIN